MLTRVMAHDPAAVARAALQAFADSDRDALEALVADDFHFDGGFVDPPGRSSAAGDAANQA